MAQQTIDIGTVANDGTGDPIRDAFDKCNDNFTELYGSFAGLLELKGNTDCSANPNYPAALKGDTYYVTAAGKIGGASGKSVDIADVYIAKADNAGGTEASVGTSWFVLEHNLAAMLPLSGGTLSGALQVPDDVYDATAWNGSTEVPTKNAVRDKIEAVILAGGYTDEQVRDVIGAALVAGANVTITVNDAGDTITIAASGGGGTMTFGVTIDGGGSVISTGVKGFIRIPVAHTITKVTVLSIDAAVTSGSIVFDVWRDSYANYPPTVADTITASDKPTLSSAIKSEDSTLTGWATAGNAGDIYGFKVDSVTSLTKVVLEIQATV